MLARAHRRIDYDVRDDVVPLVASAGVGYLCAKVLPHFISYSVVYPINPAAGAVFCAVSYLVSSAAVYAFDRMRDRHRDDRLIREGAGLIVGVVLSTAITNALEFPISVPQAFALTIAEIVVFTFLRRRY